MMSKGRRGPEESVPDGLCDLCVVAGMGIGNMHQCLDGVDSFLREVWSPEPHLKWQWLQLAPWCW